MIYKIKQIKYVDIWKFIYKFFDKQIERKIEKLIRRIGIFRIKAKSIYNLSKILVEKSVHQNS